MNAGILLGVLFLLLAPAAKSQRAAWRQAKDSELASVLPSRAQVESERIETEMRTASGIVNNRGQYVAGVVLLTAGYSADGKYSHYLMVQSPIRLGEISLESGNYVFGWTRAGETDALSVHVYVAATGKLLGTTEAHRIAGSSRVESLHIWPPEEKAIVQIGRFAIPYEFVKDH
jgi:hypothetical protein